MDCPTAQQSLFLSLWISCWQISRFVQADCACQLHCPCRCFSDSAQDFMANLTGLGLSEMVVGPTHTAGHRLDLVFGLGLKVGGLKLDPVVRSYDSVFLARWEICFDGLHSEANRARRFSKGSKGELSPLLDHPADKLVGLYNNLLFPTINQAAPRRPAPWFCIYRSSRFSGDLWQIKWAGKCLGHWW